MLEELDDSTLLTQEKWLKFMLERVGTNNLPQLLDHYENIQWISHEVTNRLITLAEKGKQYTASSWKLSPDEHRVSLLFIEKLMGKPINDPLLAISTPARARQARDDTTRPREGYLEAHRKETEDKNRELLRRDVTIKNLEQELQKRNEEIDKLNEMIQDLREQLDMTIFEVKKNQMYRGILKENLRLKKSPSFQKRNVT